MFWCYYFYMKKTSATIRYLIAVVIYGTIGFFLHYVNASSEFVVLCRGVIGSLFIGVVMLASENLPDIKAIKNNLKYIVVSGIALGLNWVFLFEGYRYSVAVASLCNYIAPIIVVIISSMFLKEKLNNFQIGCIILAFVGIVLISGVLDQQSKIDYRCVIYGLLAAVGFVILVLCNKQIKDIKPLDNTIAQLLVSALTVLPYVIINNSFPKSLDLSSGMILLCLGIIHTGIAYIFYFNSIDELPANKVAIYGYIEPVLSVLTGAFVFNEELSIYGIIGAVLILASALVNEIVTSKK